MKKLILSTMLALTPFIAGAVDVEPGQAMPAWTAMDFAGNEVSFPEVIDGKPTIVVFWATWCPYCKAFMPNLGRIQKDYGTDKINVLLINDKERGHGDPAAYASGLDFDFIGVAEGDEIANAIGVRFIPGLMIVAADGTLAWKRASTDLPAGKTVADFWEGQVRAQLDLMLGQHRAATLSRTDSP